MVEHILFVAGSKRTKDSLMNQLKEYLPHSITVEGLCIQEGIKKPVSGKLVIFSSEEAYNDIEKMGLLGQIEKPFICTRTINYENIEEVVNLPKGTKVIFVNDKAETVRTCINDLLEMGINNVEYIEYYSGILEEPDLNEIQIAITPGEADKVPPQIPVVIDIGARVIDILSLYKIMKILGLKESQVDSVYKKYMKKIIGLAQKVSDIKEQVDVLKRNIRQEVLLRGHYAQYMFDDIIGCSEDMYKAKKRAEKLAGTELTILIEGESGTGKELFASAIHNSSNRKEQAFIAVNFSALPEELVESELFGYAEGAFTGAKKGGKAGIFEVADGGTIFLDEIGDISPRVQTKLLRVLQEKEIMSIGDTKIKKVDIRIIAATNSDLAQMVKEKKFRSDLYYRLKVGQIYLPPLRSRKEDIIRLTEHFLQYYSPEEPLRVEEEVKEILLENKWEGNVRELESMIQFMLAVRTSNKLTLEDIPDEHFFSWEKTDSLLSEELTLDWEEARVLKAIKRLLQEKGSAGRESISFWLNVEGLNYSPGQVRRITSQLKEKGYISISKGSKGIVLTSKGGKWQE